MLTKHLFPFYPVGERETMIAKILVAPSNGQRKSPPHTTIHRGIVVDDSENTPESESDQPASDSAYVPPESVSDKDARPLRVRRIGIAIGIATVGIGMLQWLAPNFDHQVANMFSILVGLVTVLYIAYEVHVAFASRGIRWGVPLTLVGGIACFLVMFRVDGFSGEMLPNLRFRFGSEARPEWKETVTADSSSEESANGKGTTSVSSQNANGDDSADQNVAGTSSDTASSEKAATEDSETEFTQFLGKHRNGVIADRRFRVPADEQAVQVLWDQGVGAGWSSFAVKDNRAVTLEQRDEFECVTCYRLEDGELLWIHKHEALHQNALGGVGPRTTPAIHKGKVYTNGATGFVHCIDLMSGKILWTKDLLKEAGWTQVESERAVSWGHSTSPLILDSLGMVVLGLGGPVDSEQADDEGMTDTPKSLIAMGLDSGNVLWKTGRDQMAYASPVFMTIAGIPQIVSVNEKTVTGHLPQTGNKLWSFSWPGQSNGGANCAAAVPAGKDRILVGKGYGGGSALMEIKASGTKGLQVEEVWASTRVLRTKFNHSCIDGNVAYAIDNGSLSAVEVSTGERLWTQPRRSRLGQGQVLLVDDVIVAQSEYGDVVFVEANRDEYHELARLPAFDSKTWNIPTVAGRHLLVRNDRRAICFLLPPIADAK